MKSKSKVFFQAFSFAGLIFGALLLAGCIKKPDPVACISSPSSSASGVSSWTDVYDVGALYAKKVLFIVQEPRVNKVNLNLATTFSALQGGQFLSPDETTYLTEGDEIEFRFKVDGDWFGTGSVMDSPPPYFLNTGNEDLFDKVRNDYYKHTGGAFSRFNLSTYLPTEEFKKNFCNSDSNAPYEISEANPIAGKYYVPMFIKNQTPRIVSKNLACEEPSSPSNNQKNPYYVTQRCRVVIQDENESVISQALSDTKFLQFICAYTTQHGSTVSYLNGDNLTSTSSDQRLYAYCTISGHKTDYNVRFSKEKIYPAVISNIGNGSGSVSDGEQVANLSASEDLTMSSATFNYKKGSSISFSANSNSDSDFNGWGGACAGTAGNVCTVTMDAAKEVKVKFDLKSPAPPIPSPTPCTYSCVDPCVDKTKTGIQTGICVSSCDGTVPVSFCDSATPASCQYDCGNPPSNNNDSTWKGVRP